MNYGGPPSVPQTAAAGIVGVKRDAQGNWRDCSNILRDEIGYIVPIGPRQPPAIGPDRDFAHDQAVQLLDRIIERTIPPGDDR
jgi:hypothetical protein